MKKMIILMTMVVSNFSWAVGSGGAWPPASIDSAEVMNYECTFGPENSINGASSIEITPVDTFILIFRGSEVGGSDVYLKNSTKENGKKEALLHIADGTKVIGIFKVSGEVRYSISDNSDEVVCK